MYNIFYYMVIYFLQWCTLKKTITTHYYMARAYKNITHAVIGQYWGPNFPVMPTGITSDVNSRLVKREYRKCESKFV